MRRLRSISGRGSRGGGARRGPTRARRARARSRALPRPCRRSRGAPGTQAPKSSQGQASRDRHGGRVCDLASTRRGGNSVRHRSTSWGSRVPVCGSSDGRVSWLPDRRRIPTFPPVKAVAAGTTPWLQWRDRAGLAPASPHHRLVCAESTRMARRQRASRPIGRPASTSRGRSRRAGGTDPRLLPPRSSVFHRPAMASGPAATLLWRHRVPLGLALALPT